MTKRPFTIIVGVDFEPDGELALDQAIRIASGNPESEVHVLFVDRELSPSSRPPASSGSTDAESSGVSRRATRAETALDRVEQLAHSRIEAAQKVLPGLTFQRVVTHFRLGGAATQIVQLAVDLDADLIVVGTRNRKGIKRLVLGSVAEKVVHSARCPVYVARIKDHDGIGDVPEIEPPCADCVKTRTETQGAELWCARHQLAQYHPRMHRYSYTWGSAGAPGVKEPTGPTMS